MPEPAIHDWPLPYVDKLDERELDSVDLVVIHCTELPDLAMARSYGERVLYASGSGNSGHYYIDRDGAIHRFVPDARVAHHTRGFNARSVGVELVNAGRYPDWLDSRHQAMNEPYPDAQIAGLRDLLAQLVRALPNLARIAGHEDLDTTLVPASDDPRQSVRRKRDPGALFPWNQVCECVPLRRLRSPDAGGSPL